MEHKNERGREDDFKFPVGKRVVFKGINPYQNHYGHVVSHASGISLGWTGAGAIVKWDLGDISFVPYWTQRFQVA